MAGVDVTRRLVELVAGTTPDVIGAEAREKAGRAFLDTLGVMLAGCREPSARLVAEQVQEQGGAAEATVIGASLRAPTAQAALANGAAAHALDYDDVQANMRGHPSAPLVPAVLALGEKLGSGGQDVLDAYVLGFEVECKLGRAIGEQHYALGWHATSTLGTIGAAAACARLLALDADRTRKALGIAASLAGGLQQNFGTMTKPLHAGWAAHSGVLAAGLAARGFEADATALEGPSGFLRAMSGGAEVDAEAAVRDLGEPWEVIEPGIGVKLYPCCYATHRAIDASLEVRGRRGFDPGTVDGVDLHLSKGTLLPLIGRLPETGLEAKFSMEFCVAAALLHGAPGLSGFTDQAAARGDVRTLACRVTCVEDGPEMAYPIEGWARIVVTTDGGSFEAEVDAPRGDPRNPLTWDELCGKFRDCAAPVLGRDRTDFALGMFTGLEALSDIGDLVRGL
jgi:2-methylcitrate dehydratase PrpD